MFFFAHFLVILFSKVAGGLSDSSAILLSRVQSQDLQHYGLEHFMSSMYGCSLKVVYALGTVWGFVILTFQLGGICNCLKGALIEYSRACTCV